jgi:fermentation-respiration switch protein FrsA (DUF1100 family)
MPALLVPFLPLFRGCLFAACLALTVGCGRLVDAFLYAPERALAGAPGAVGLDYEELAFAAEDGVDLHGWWVPGRRPGPAVVFFHGRAGNVSHRLDILRRLHDRVGLGVMIFDYRGYGKSRGTPSEEGLYADGRAARALVRARGWDRHGAILYGRGLGAAVAIYSALEEPPLGCVLEAAFTSVEELVRLRYPLLAGLAGPWVEGLYPNLSRVRELRTPTLFLHGDRDAVVPIGMGWRLFDACAGPKWFRTLQGAGHDDPAFVGGDAYWEAWEEFVSRLEAKELKSSAATADR